MRRVGVAVALLGLCLCVWLSAPFASAAQPPAGTVIRNQATATYTHSGLGITETIQSNVVTAVVRAVVAFELEPGPTITVPVGGQTEHRFVVTSLSNTPIDLIANLSQATTDDFDHEALRLFVDANGNGTIDPGEPRLAQGGSLRLSPGQSETVIALARAPAQTAEGDTATVALRFEEPTQGLVKRSVATTNIVEAGLTLVKQAALIPSRGSGNDADSANEIRYRLTVSNPFTRPVARYNQIDGEPIRVDGNARDVVLVRDAIPVNTTFARFEATTGFVPVYHLRGAATHSYVQAAPSDLSRVDAVAFMRTQALSAGAVLEAAFTVAVNDNAAGVVVENTAVGYRSARGGTAIEDVASNRVDTVVPENGFGTIQFMTPSFNAVEDSLNLPSNAYVQVDAGLCNATAQVDRVAVRIRSPGTGDVETVTAIETGPNTGVFRTPAVSVLKALPAQAQDGVLSAEPTTILTASAVCQAATLTTQTVVEPGGHVFDALTQDPIAGVTVQVRDSSGHVVGEATTDRDGFFSIAVAAGVYHVTLRGNKDRTFPSQVSHFPGASRVIDARASYGRTFTVSDAKTLTFDIPIDPKTDGLLFATKSVDQDTARVGQFLTYEIKVKNNFALSLVAFEIVDWLPKGLAYVDGTARVDGRPLADPAGRPGRGLVFDVGQLPGSSETTLRYVAKVLPSAGDGKRVNRALAQGQLPVSGASVVSNTARATVEIDERGGVFDRRATVLGKVYLECDGDNIPGGDGEVGIAGVKLHLNNGISVVTDADGLYSISGLRPVTHVIGVYSKTLPSGMRPQVSRMRDAGNPRTRFLDMKSGEVRVESFPVGPCSSDAKFALEKRRLEFEGLANDERLLRDDLPLTAEADEPQSLRRQGERDTRTEVYREDDRGWRTRLKAAQERARQIGVTRKLVEEVRGLDRELGFLDLRDGDVLSRSHVSVRFKGRSGARIALYLNGEQVGGERLGQYVDDVRGGVQAGEYVSLELADGTNTLELTETDPFGNVRKRRKLEIVAVGRPAAVEISAPETAPADSHSPVPVVVGVLDASGRPVSGRVELTLRADGGRWDARDLRRDEPGTQVLVANGEAVFDYIPPDLVGTRTLSASGAMGRSETRVSLVANARDHVMIGLIEGAFTFGHNGQSLAPYLDRSDLSQFEDTTQGLRGSIYLKGRVIGDALLTLRYDSDDDTSDRLFRDIEPDRYYPVYGDTSERGADALATGPLYVKIEKGRSYLLYGDTDNKPQADAIQLGGYRRELTGARGRLDYGRVTVNVFAARTTSEQSIVEIRADGTSGPYDFDIGGLVENSERVELVTRDRDRPGVILSQTPQRRFTDYTLDYFAGTLIFNRPIDSSDEDLNPVFIRLTAEVDRGVAPYWVYGAEARITVTKGLAFGAREIRSEAPATSQDRRTVRSAYVEGTIAGRGKWSVEAAESIDADGQRGRAVGARYSVKSQSTKVTVDAARTDDTFDPPNSGVSEGRTVARVKAEHFIREGMTLSVDALYARQSDAQERRGIEGRVRQRLIDGLDVIWGARYVETSHADEIGFAHMFSGIAGLQWQPAWWPAFKAHLEYERDVQSAANYRVLTGVDYRYSKALRFYVENEITTSDAGVFDLNSTSGENLTTKSGFEYAWSDSISTFVEYRESRSFEGGIATGFRVREDFGDSLSARLKIENVEPFQSYDDRSLAVAFGLMHQNADKSRLLRGDVEWSRRSNRKGWYANQAIGWRFAPSWTFLMRNRFALSDEESGLRLRDRLRIGAALRPVDHDKWAGLAWYELSYDDDPDTARRLTHMWSFAGQYRIDRNLYIRPKYAGRYHEFGDVDFETTSLLHLAQMGLEYELTDDLSWGVQASLFFDQDGANRTTGLGSELSYRLTDDVIATVGYNYSGLKDEDIRDIYQQGAYIRLKAKIDGETWDIFQD